MYGKALESEDPYENLRGAEFCRSEDVRPRVVRNGNWTPRISQKQKGGDDDPLGEDKGGGFFISFEGCEGSGKTTQAEMLRSYFEEKGVDVILTREPGGTRTGNLIRQILLDPELEELTPITEALLFAANRAQVVIEVIKPALDQGIVVISDRFTDSSLAYQGVGRGLGLEAVKNLNEWATGGLEPNVTFYLDISYEDSLSRRNAEIADRIEMEPKIFHENVRQAYAMLARIYPARIVTLDARSSPEDIHSRVVSEIRKRML